MLFSAVVSKQQYRAGSLFKFLSACACVCVCSQERKRQIAQQEAEGFLRDLQEEEGDDLDLQGREGCAGACVCGRVYVYAHI